MAPFGETVFIIAEAGVNHNGDIETAKRLIDAAAAAGADAVKFQSFKAETLVNENAPKADYQIITTGKEEAQRAMLKGLELSTEAHEELFAYSKKRNICFLSSPFDLSSVDLLCTLGVKYIKIASGEITNLPLLRKIGAAGKPAVLSTGMSFLKEVKDAHRILTEGGIAETDIAVLQCTTEYPVPVDEVNLRAMQTMQQTFPRSTVGYSDHTTGIEIAVAAVALGARVIEKHLTLDKTLEGPDHRASIDPSEFSALVAAVRNVEKALGKKEKQPTPSEMKNISLIRKSIVAAQPIKKGEIFSVKNITVKRPADGLSPMRIDSILGKRAKRNYNPDECIEA